MREDIIRRAEAALAASDAQRARMAAIQPRPVSESKNARAVWLTASLLYLVAALTQTEGGHAPSAAFLILAPVPIILYLLPSFVAYKRGRVNKSAILMLNLLLGWTFIAWVIALVWSTTTPAAPRAIQSNRMGLGEVAVRAAVRATAWETTISIFRLFR